MDLTQGERERFPAVDDKVAYHVLDDISQKVVWLFHERISGEKN